MGRPFCSICFLKPTANKPLKIRIPPAPPMIMEEISRISISLPSVFQKTLWEVHLVLAKPPSTLNSLLSRRLAEHALALHLFVELKKLSSACEERVRDR